jgi:putative hydrolase of the HAD superfamily
MSSSLTAALRVAKAVIFDLFHTLTNLESTLRLHTADILGVRREDWNKQLLERSSDRLLGRITDPVRILKNLAYAIDPEIPEAKIIDAVSRRMQGFRQSLINMPDETISVLQRLRESGKKLGLISNADCGEIKAWSESPIATYFDSTIFSCEVGYVKPQRQIYEICLRELRVTARECIFVGDGGLRELEGARAVGMSAICMCGVIMRIWPELVESRKQQADYAISSLSELSEL